MLTQTQAEKLAQQQQTVVDNIIKEHYQMYLLDQLFASKIEGKIVFKGGTALRLAYNSYRYSEDLDFSLIGNVDFADFEKVIITAVNLFPEATLQDIYDKHFNLYAKINFKVGYKPIPIGVKVEMSKEKTDFPRQISLLISPNNNLEVTARVMNLESILKDKVKILTEYTRRQPRDLFDVWYIYQKLGREFKVEDRDKYTQRELMNRLNPLLPVKNRKVMELFQI